MRGIIPQNPLLEILDKQQEERKAPAEYHYIGSVRRVKGHTLFSYNTDTKALKRADMQREVSVGIEGKPKYNTKTLREKNCVYIQALNLENARKKLIKLGIIND